MKNKIDRILDKYKEYLIKNKLSDKKDDISVFFTISQIEKFYNDEFLYEYFLQLCKDLKYNIENKKIPYSISMIGGLGQYVFSVNEFSKNTGSLVKFNDDLHLYYVNYIKKIFELYSKNNQSSYLNYDVINGASGILYYLVENKDIIKNDEIILYLIEYLSNISLFDKTTNDDIIMNFGLAHGIIGILISLCKAYNSNYRLKNQFNKINHIFEIYEKFQILRKNTTYFPSIVSYDEFYEESFDIKREDRTYTWCYGSITILRSLIKSYNYMNDKIKSNQYTDLLINTLNTDYSNYKLNVPIICHGYSSVINIIKSSFNDNLFKTKYVQNLDIEYYFIKKIIDEIDSSNLDIYINKRFKNDISFLQGFGGVILTLSRYIQNNTSFDKLLLID